MAKVKNPNRENALKIYINHKGNIKLSEIAKELNENPSNIRTWKRLDEWDKKLPKVGAPKGNKNAKGNKGGGAPKCNINAVRHGLYMSNDRILKNLDKILPLRLVNTIKMLKEDSLLDKMLRQILLTEAKIIESYGILELKDKEDHTIIEKKSYLEKNGIDEVGEVIEYAVQTAYDKQNSSNAALSKLKDTLAKLIKQYDEMLHKDWGAEKELHMLKVEKLRKEVYGDNKDTTILDSLVGLFKEHDSNRNEN